jgi:hypothetical protein
MTNIERKIQEVEAKIAENEAIEAFNDSARNIAYDQMIANIQGHLLADGFQNLKSARISMWSTEDRKLDLLFGANRHEFRATLSKKGIDSYSISGISGSTNRGEDAINIDEILEVTDYYESVSNALKALTKGFPKLWKLIESFKWPVAKPLPYDTISLKKTMADLETIKKVNSLKLYEGKDIEYFEPKLGSSKWGNNWAKGTVVKMTPKLIWINSELGGCRQIKRESVSEQIRSL